MVGKLCQNLSKSGPWFQSSRLRRGNDSQKGPSTPAFNFVSMLLPDFTSFFQTLRANPRLIQILQDIELWHWGARGECILKNWTADKATDLNHSVMAFG